MTHNTEASAPSDWQPLDWLTVSGFKSIQSVRKLEMRRINVVIGANGSGKSNLIKVFSFLEALRAGRLEEYVDGAGGGDRVLHFGAKTTGELTIEVSFGNEVNRYEITLVPNELDRLVPSNEKANEESLSSVGVEAGISKDVGTGVLSWVQSRLDRWQLYHFHDTGRHSPFKKACALHDNEFLRPDGSNLPAFLYFLKMKHQESYSLIRRTIRLVAPFFDDDVAFSAREVVAFRHSAGRTGARTASLCNDDLLFNGQDSIGQRPSRPCNPVSSGVGSLRAERRARGGAEQRRVVVHETGREPSRCLAGGLQSRSAVGEERDRRQAELT